MSLMVVPPEQSGKPGNVSELLDAWKGWLELRIKAGELAENTAITYLRGVNKFIRWCEEHEILQVDENVLRRWKADLLSQGRKVRAVGTWMAGVKSLFNWAVKNHVLLSNPAKEIQGASRKGGSKHAREPLTDLEVRRLLVQPDKTTKIGLRDLAILYLMLYTGIRSIEIHRADYNDLRTQAGQLVLDLTGKGHVEADEVAVIANVNAQNAIYDWLVVRGNQPGPLFPSLSRNNYGGRISLRSLRGLVKGYFRKAGVRGNKTTHSLRHTAITKVITQSGSIYKAKTVARHKSVDATMVYFHEVDRLENPGEAFIDYGE